MITVGIKRYERMLSNSPFETELKSVTLDGFK